MTGDELPKLRTAIPGPTSRARVDILARHECPAITARRTRRAAAIGADHDDPVVWSEALGSNVLDVDGNVLVDLNAGFGVALLGHRHPAVVAAAHAQTDRLLHAMGDAWPDETRIRLLQALAGIAPPGLEVAILGLSGSDAVEVAVKTAVIATGRTRVIAFEGGYHGLALGAVALQGYSPAFSAPFKGIAHPDVVHLPWGCDPNRVAEAARGAGLLLVEPIQGRGGMRTAPPGWLAQIGEAARSAGALVCHDEIYTGLGRAGDTWAGPAEGAVPDLLCTGKALGGGFPLSACLGTRAVMDAWGASTGQAIHTQTFLGHPIGCAAALAVIDEVKTGLPGRCADTGERLRSALHARGFQTRGRGLIVGVELANALAVSRRLLHRGWLALPAGMQAEVLGLTPSVCLTDRQIQAFCDTLKEVA